MVPDLLADLFQTLQHPVVIFHHLRYVFQPAEEIRNAGRFQQQLNIAGIIALIHTLNPLRQSLRIGFLLLLRLRQLDLGLHQQRLIVFDLCVQLAEPVFQFLNPAVAGRDFRRQLIDVCLHLLQLLFLLLRQSADIPLLILQILQLLLQIRQLIRIQNNGKHRPQKHNQGQSQGNNRYNLSLFHDSDSLLSFTVLYPSAALYLQIFPD